MKAVFIVLGLVAVAMAAEAEFSFGGVKKAAAKSKASPGDDMSAKKGEWTSSKSVTVNKVKFSNPTWMKMKLGDKRVPTFKVKIGKVVYYYPLSGTHSGMWLTYKDIKSKSGRVSKKLQVDMQKFRVWYRKSCKVNTFSGAVTCGFCFKINGLTGVLDYGATETVTISDIKYDLGAYKPSHNVLGKNGNSKHEVVFAKVTAGGDDYSLFLALNGKYENKVIIGVRGKVNSVDSIKLDVYKRKYCSRGLYGKYRCRYCFILSSASKSVFLPGPNILMGEEDGSKMYLNSPQYKQIGIKMDGKTSKRETVRLILSQSGSTNMIFFYYVLDGEEAGQIWYHSSSRGWAKSNLKVIIYTRRVCRKAGDNKSCYIKLKTYKNGAGPKSTSSMKAGGATLGKPKVAVVKTPKLGVSRVRAAVFSGSKYQGDEFALNYAMDGPYAGTWFYVNSHKGVTKVFTPAAGKALYHYKSCKQSFSGAVGCKWCFLMVDKVEKATGLPKGKTLTVSKATFSLPVDEKRSGAEYTRMNYSKGKVNKTLWVKRKGKTASSGKWFQENKKGRLTPYDVSYDVYFMKICTKFGKKTECRHCYKVAARPALAIKPIQPATKLTLATSKIELSISETKQFSIMKGSKTHGKAHKFKACKSGKCADFYYVSSGPYAGNWFNGVAKKKLYFKSSVISNKVWKHYECQDGLKGVVCRYCFTF